MFILEYFFGSILLLFFIFFIFALNLFQLLKVRSFSLCVIKYYLYELRIKWILLCDFFFYLKNKRIILLYVDWFSYIEGCFIFFCTFFFVLLFYSLVFNMGFDGFHFFSFMHSFVIGNFFKIFCFFLFILFFIILKFIVYFCSYVVFEFFFFFVCIFWGIYMVLSVFDLMSLYIFIELQGVCFYVLAALYNNNFRTIDSGLKYYIFGSLASSCLLFGFFLLYYCTGLFGLFEIFMFCGCMSFDFIFFFALLFIFISFLCKLMIFPFHFWALDVYDGSTYIVTSYFLIFSKVSFFYLVWFFFNIIFYKFFFYFKFLFLYTALFAIVYSVFLCFVQINIKRFFICSSYNHIGFIIGALSCDTNIGVWSFFFYIFVYMLMTFLLWSLLNIINSCKYNNFIYLTDLCGLFNSYFYIAIIFIIVLFSMAGLPPFIGFFAKFYVIYSLVNSDFYMCGFMFLLFSVVSAFYYIRVLRFIFIDQIIEPLFYSNVWFSLAIVLCLFSIAFGLFIYYFDIVACFGLFLLYFI